MILLLILNMLVIPQDDASDALSTTAGDSLQGRFVSVDENRLRWQDKDGETPIDLASVERVRFDADEPVPSGPAATFEVHLVDGSLILGANLSTNADGVEVTTGERVVSIPRRNVFGIRFFEQESLTDAQRTELDTTWLENRSEELAEDVLTLRKLDENEEGVEIQTFSNFEGVIESIDAENVQFQFGGDSVAVKRERIAFVRYYHPAGRTLPEPECLVKLDDGSTLQAKTVTGARDAIRIATAAGVQIELPASALEEIDFAYGRVVYLDALQPVTAEWTPFFRSSVSESHLAELNRYRTNEAFDGNPLSVFQLDGTTGDRFGTSNVREFSRGLALRSESRLIYPTSQKYSRFVAIAGIDPAVRPRGNVEFTIRGDGEILFQAQISGTDNEPVRVDVPIEGVRRLSLEVGFGEQLDIGDQLNLCRARLIK